MADRIRELEAEVERLRQAIRAAMDTMSVATDMQLGPGGVARKAYADLYVAYFTTPKMALATAEVAVDSWCEACGRKHTMRGQVEHCMGCGGNRFVFRSPAAVDEIQDPKETPDA